jgi:hypothetical protein
VAGADTRDHLFNECAATASLRDDLHASLVRLIGGGALFGQWAGGPVAQLAADEVLRRRDWFAGQISAGVLDILRGARLAAAGGSLPLDADVRATGRIQSIALEYSLAIHKKRTSAVPKALSLNAFRKAMWAAQKQKQQQKAKRTPKAAAGVAAAVQGTAPAPLVPTMVAIATRLPCTQPYWLAAPTAASSAGVAGTCMLTVVVGGTRVAWGHPTQAPGAGGGTSGCPAQAA